MNANRAVILTLALLMGAGLAGADTQPGTPQVYDFDAGPGGVKVIENTSSESVNLQITLGTDLTTGGLTPCVDGDGDDLCAAEVVVTLVGPGLITGFSPGTDVIFEPDPVVPTNELRLNLLQSVSPPMPGEQGLGTLFIDNSAQTSSSFTQVTVSGSVVDAAGKLRTISVPPVAVPEPSSVVLFVSGVLGLSALYRLRTRGCDPVR